MLLRLIVSVVLSTTALLANAERSDAIITDRTSAANHANNDIIPPIWVEDPRLVRHIAVSGSAAPARWGGEQAQYNTAMQVARANLQTEFKKHRDALQKIKNNIPGEHSNSEIDQRINRLLLENAIVQAEWKHPTNGTLYLWLVIPNN